MFIGRVYIYIYIYLLAGLHMQHASATICRDFCIRDSMAASGRSLQRKLPTPAQMQAQGDIALTAAGVKCCLGLLLAGCWGLKCVA